MTMNRRAIALAIYTMGMIPAGAIAQDSPRQIQGLDNFSLQASPKPAPTPAPAPAGPSITLPTINPTITPPATTPTPTPSATTTPSTVTRAPTPTVSPTPTPAPAETPRVTRAKPERQAPAPTPDETPPPAANAVAPPTAISPTPTPASRPSPTAPAVDATSAAPASSSASQPLWPWLAGGAVAVLIAAGLWSARRRAEGELVETAAYPTPEPEPPAEAPQFLDPAPAAPAPRARVAIDLRPKRAGLNLLSATAESEILVTNFGHAPAEGLRIQASLLSAHAGLDADIAAINAAPIVRPAVPPFALAPGESRTVRIVAALPRDAIHALTAADRPMVVPIVAVNLRYATGAIEGQTARAWAIGIERVDSPKLAPFWLDGPARMYDAVAARPHAAASER